MLISTVSSKKLYEITSIVWYNDHIVLKTNRSWV
jgi:hypothetical protein